MVPQTMGKPIEERTMITSARAMLREGRERQT
jgi:hypothetical protein